MIGEFVQAVMTYGFLQRAFVGAILVGFVAGIVGVFVILRGLSLMGDAISHSVLPGVALSHVLGISHVFGAALFGILASMMIGFIGDRSKLKNDTVMGIVFSLFFSLGIVMVSRIRTTTDLHHILFGNVLAVRADDVRIIGVVAILLVLFVGLFYKELVVTSFDATHALVYGLKVRVFHYAFLFVLTLIIVASLQTVGATLIVAMIITPAATSYLLTSRLPVMLGLSAFIGVVSAILGMFFSFSFNLASGATIVLVASVIFMLVLVFSPKKGVLSRFVRNRFNV